MPPLTKVFERGTLVRSGGDVLVEMYGPVYAGPGSRWGFRIIAKTDKRGRMKADVEYYPMNDFKKKTKVSRSLDDFSEEALLGLAEQIVREATTGVTTPPNDQGIRPFDLKFRAVDYAADMANAGLDGRSQKIVVSVQVRQMQLTSSDFAAEPYTAEVGRRTFRNACETPANGLTIDDAYAAILKVLAHWENELLEEDED